MPQTRKNPPQKKVSKPMVAAVIVLAAAALIGGIKYLKWTQGGAVNAETARTKGNPKAPVHIIEWVDFQCPACAGGAEDLKKYLATFPDKIYLEVKLFPLGGHVHSLQASKFGECAARQGKFWPFYELVFERQPQWRDLFDAYPAFEQISKDIGLNDGQLRACLAKDDVREKILSEKDAGTALGIQSTPTYFVNGKMLVGPRPMKEEVEKLLGGTNH